ncbi:hypothetical protein L2E82_11904 [Cichorium intybus]|uniref:Uncharacterized protein n=1 Tax=Cichorium intybus TaxID=13427 RepID=A0ACB9GFM7_CICIN|nr:hypothetical protein L2E82_11904 [Cichorium intybus]
MIRRNWYKSLPFAVSKQKGEYKACGTKGVFSGKGEWQICVCASESRGKVCVAAEKVCCTHGISCDVDAYMAHFNPQRPVVCLSIRSKIYNLLNRVTILRLLYTTPLENPFPD